MWDAEGLTRNDYTKLVSDQLSSETKQKIYLIINIKIIFFFSPSRSSRLIFILFTNCYFVGVAKLVKETELRGMRAGDKNIKVSLL